MKKCKSCDAEIPADAPKCVNPECGVPTGVPPKKESVPDDVPKVKEPAESDDEWCGLDRW